MELELYETVEMLSTDTVQAALGLAGLKAGEISWRLLEASITRIKYNRHGMMLDGFNEPGPLTKKRPV